MIEAIHPGSHQSRGSQSTSRGYPVPFPRHLVNRVRPNRILNLKSHILISSITFYYILLNLLPVPISARSPVTLRESSGCGAKISGLQDSLFDPDLFRTARPFSFSYYLKMR